MAISADDIIGIMAAESGIDVDRLVPDATLQSLDISSLDVVSVMFELEDRFGISIDPDAITPDFTVGRFIAHVQAIGQATGPQPLGEASRSAE